MIKKQLKKLNSVEIIKYGRNNKKHWENVLEIMKSIQANTYIAPIIVDEENVILAGHWRFEAMTNLWMTEIEVLQVSWLTEIQKKDYRLRDNKLSELSEWDLDNVKIELESIDSEDLNMLFEEKLEDANSEEIDFDNISWNEDRKNSDKSKTVECPECWSSFTI